jgi:hypothetical protein
MKVFKISFQYFPESTSGMVIVAENKEKAIEIMREQSVYNDKYIESESIEYKGDGKEYFSIKEVRLDHSGLVYEGNYLG